MRVIFDPSRGQRVPVFAWSSALADDTARQLAHLASQPWVVDHVAAMARCEHKAHRQAQRIDGGMYLGS